MKTLFNKDFTLNMFGEFLADDTKKALKSIFEANVAAGYSPAEIHCIMMEALWKVQTQALAWIPGPKDLEIEVIGLTWEGNFSTYIFHCRASSRAEVKEWLKKNAGDFQSIVDFRAIYIVNGSGEIIFDWVEPDSYSKFNGELI